jgi:hypothetical protein
MMLQVDLHCFAAADLGGEFQPSPPLREQPVWITLQLVNSCWASGRDGLRVTTEPTR